MRITDVQERSVPISRYADASIASGDLTTSVVALTTDVLRDGKPVVGYGFSSFGRYAQGGLIRERFAPRLLAGGEDGVANAERTNIDPDRAWATMMAGEKSGGHGERCVAVGTLDMALWDAAAKIAGQPLRRFLADRLSCGGAPATSAFVYASGGYPYPTDDLDRLRDEIRALLDQGYTHAKIKIGAGPLSADLKRIDVAQDVIGRPEALAVDAMNRFGRSAAFEAAEQLADRNLWWFEDVCDPLDFELQGDVARAYGRAIAAGEALFSLAEAKLLVRHGGLTPSRDILLFDPVHCYGLSHYLQIVEMFDHAGWPRSAHWPHGGHLFALHIACALGLGGAEVNPFAFQPFGGLASGANVENGRAQPPEAPGIGFEERNTLIRFLADQFR